jgi:hypothetical protein
MFNFDNNDDLKNDMIVKKISEILDGKKCEINV